MRSRALHADDGFRIYSADGHRGWRPGGRRCVDCRIRYRQPAYHPKRNQARGRGRSIPHAIGTGLRLWMMREHVDRRVLFSFGVTSLPVHHFFLSRQNPFVRSKSCAWPLLSCIRTFCFLVYGNTGYTAAELAEEARFRLLLSIYKCKQLVFFLINQKPLRVLTFF